MIFIDCNLPTINSIDQQIAKKHVIEIIIVKLAIACK